MGKQTFWSIVIAILAFSATLGGLEFLHITAVNSLVPIVTLMLIAYLAMVAGVTSSTDSGEITPLNTYSAVFTVLAVFLTSLSVFATILSAAMAFIVIFFAIRDAKNIFVHLSWTQCFLFYSLIPVGVWGSFFLYTMVNPPLSYAFALFSITSIYIFGMRLRYTENKYLPALV